MAIKPKSILDTAVGIGKAAVSAGVDLAGRVRGGGRDSDVVRPTPAATEPVRAAGTKTGGAAPGSTRTARAKSGGTKSTPKRRTSASPSSVGAAKPGEAGGP